MSTVSPMASEAGPAAVLDGSSIGSSPPRNAEQASAAPPAAPDSAHAGTGPETETDPEILKQQLKLIQLCFAEHEFGIVVDEHDGRHGGSSSASSSSSSSRSSSAESSAASSSSALSSASPKRYGGRYSAFDSLRFVKGKAQHGVPLPVLSQDLHSYARYLEDKIAECVNTDVHTAFVNVSGHLVGMRDELSYMERPLAAAMEKLSSAVGQLSEASHSVKSRVEAACAAEMERTFDSAFLRGVVVYETIAYQLDDLAQLLRMTVDAAPSRSPAGGSGGGGGGGVVGSSAHDSAARDKAAKKEVIAIPPDAQLSDGALDILEDVVLLFQELKEVSQRLVSLPTRHQEKAEMAGYLSAAEQAVMGVLEAVLVHVSRLTFGGTAAGDAAHASGDVSSAGTVAPAAPAARQLLGRVIELYSQAGEREHFCSVFRNAVLRPPLEAVVSWKAATQARQSADSTVALLAQMKSVLQTKYLPLLPLLRESYSGSLHPVATIVWPILSETLVKKLPSLYEVGIPQHFQVKYKAAYDVLATVEAACADVEELAALRQSPDVVLWNHKWNLDVYAALRVSEVDKALQSVASPLDRLPPSAGGEYRLRISYILHQQLLHLFSPQVFLYLCTPRFLRQAVACCFRVLQRVQDGVSRLPAASAAQSEHDAAANGASTSSAAQPATDTLLLAIADAHALRGFFSGQLRSLILERLHEQAGSAAAAGEERSTAALVSDVTDFASNTVCAQFVQHAVATLVRHVSDAVVEPLQNVKSVRSAYSHTRKTIPSAASWYVAPTLQPLQHFAEEAQRAGFDGAAWDATVVEMLRALVRQFVLLAKDTLLTAKKTEESWEKLRRRKEGTAAGSGAAGGAGGTDGGAVDGAAASVQGGPAEQRVTMETATDRDKMTIQLWMDARAMLQAVQQPPLGVPESAAAEAFEPAFELLRRAEWIQGANIPEPPDVDA